MHLHAHIVQILHILECAAAFLAKIHDAADIFLRRKNIRLDDRLLRLGNIGRIRIIGRVVDHHNLAVRQRNAIDYRRRSRNQIQIVFTFQSLLNDLHMQQAEEAAAESEAQCNGGFRLKGQRCVIQLQFFQCVAQVVIMCAVRRIDTGKDHRADLAVSGQRLCTRIVRQCNCVTDARITDALDRSGQIPDLTGFQLAAVDQVGRTHDTGLDDLKFSAGRHKTDPVTDADSALFDTDVDDDALIGIIAAVENQRLKRSVLIALRCRNIGHDAFQHFFNIRAHFGGNARRIHTGNADHVFDLLRNAVRFRRRQVDLVDHRQQFQICLDGKICICKCLCFDALRCIHDQDRTLTGSQRAADLIIKVYMAGRINQIEPIGLSVLRRIVQRNGTRLDRDAALSLDVHIIEQLFFHITHGDSAGLFKNAVSQRGFSVVNMRNDAEIADILICQWDSSVLIYILFYYTTEYRKKQDI